jgi:hypothetical protein
MHRRIAAAFAVVVSSCVVALSAACEERPAPPAYSGPIAGAAAREALRTLSGLRFRDLDGVFGGGVWTVGELVIAPHPADPSRTGPILVLSQDDQRTVVLPIECDGDANDLYRRVRGAPYAGLSTTTSEAYRAALARAQRR